MVSNSIAFYKFEELNRQQLMDISGGVDWAKVGLTVAVGIAAAFVPPPIAMAVVIVCVASDLLDGDY